MENYDCEDMFTEIAQILSTGGNGYSETALFSTNKWTYYNPEAGLKTRFSYIKGLYVPGEAVLLLGHNPNNSQSISALPESEIEKKIRKLSPRECMQKVAKLLHKDDFLHGVAIVRDGELEIPVNSRYQEKMLDGLDFISKYTGNTTLARIAATAIRTEYGK